MEPLKLTLTLVNSVSGESRTYNENYKRTGEEGPERVYHQLYEGASQSYMGHSGYKDDEAFAQHWESDKRRDHASWENSTLQRKQAEERKSAYAAAWKSKIAELFGEDSLSAKIIEEAVVDCCLNLDDLLKLHGTVKNLKRALKSTISEAKESQRSEYPEDYREADDKEEDFYLPCLGDLAEYVTRNV